MVCYAQCTMESLLSTEVPFIIIGGINLVTFVLFGMDKWSAAGGTWRTSEKTLWLFSLFGGSIGALLAMHVFRHKTKKGSFQFVMALILAIQVASVYALYYYL